MTNLERIKSRSGATRILRYAREYLFATFVVFAAYCVISNIRFLTHADGSFLMYRAAQVGLVSDDYAQAHLDNVVWFERRGDGTWEYRVPLPVLGYAAIPRVNAYSTRKDLAAVCDEVDAHGSHGCERR